MKSDADDAVRTGQPEAAEFPGSSAYWARFALLYGCGILAATGLGKIAPIAVDLRAALTLSLDQVSLVTSSITAVAAVLGLPVGYLVARTAPRRALPAGCVVMAAAGLLEARAGHFWPLLGARLVEGIGYVAVVVAVPALIIAMGGGPRRMTALAVWGTYFPVGLALGLFLGGVLSAFLGWRTWLVAQACALLVAGAAAVLARGGRTASAGEPAPAATAPSLDRRAVRRLSRPFLLSLGFATASGTIVAVVSLLPTYLHEVLHVPTSVAGTLTGAVSLTGTVGGFLSGWLLRRGVPVRRLFTGALLMPLGTAVAFLHWGGTGLAAAGAVLVALANELVVAAAFAMIPAVVADSADIDLANGLLAQVGSLGSLLGPPLVSFAVLAADGWWAVAPTVLAVCLPGTLLLRASVRRAAV
ncbi:MFS transporter [Streptomyces sp. CSDS2]|uniref:MFS transporter n=1 Tax=Streptomyces sp. CSDS2 TaxID=3055051 RepID=UPI0025B082D8|nr:MFS transporter [Streptomyces sp. CSDS2]MDN3258822.1 MFS transporter [Streptomyces sp. CSDS2]